MTNRFTRSISALLALAWAPAISAQLRDIWSAAGVTGIVDEADLRIHQLNVSGSVSIRQSVPRGTLDVRFPVQTMPGHSAPGGGSDCTELRAVLRDTGASARVTVRLMQLGISGGHEGELTSLGEIDSDTSIRWSNLDQPDQFGQYRACLNVDPSFPFDFALFPYYVDAQLIKTAKDGNPGLMAVQICHTNEQCEP
jgi:hypothetical protein